MPHSTPLSKVFERLRRIGNDVCSVVLIYKKCTISNYPIYFLQLYSMINIRYLVSVDVLLDGILDNKNPHVKNEII